MLQDTWLHCGYIVRGITVKAMPLFILIFIITYLRKYEKKYNTFKSTRKNLRGMRDTKNMWWTTWYLRTDIFCPGCFGGHRVALFIHNYEFVSDVNCAINNFMHRAICLSDINYRRSIYDCLFPVDASDRRPVIKSWWNFW